MNKITTVELVAANKVLIQFMETHQDLDELTLNRFIQWLQDISNHHISGNLK